MDNEAAQPKRKKKANAGVRRLSISFPLDVCENIEAEARLLGGTHAAKGHVVVRRMRQSFVDAPVDQPLPTRPARGRDEQTPAAAAKGGE